MQWNGMERNGMRCTIWLFNSSPWKDPPILKFGRPSISIRAIYFPWRTVSHNQVGYVTWGPPIWAIAMLPLPFQDAKDEEKSNGEDEKVRGHTVGFFKMPCP